MPGLLQRFDMNALIQVDGHLTQCEDDCCVEHYCNGLDAETMSLTISGWNTDRYCYTTYNSGPCINQKLHDETTTFADINGTYITSDFLEQSETLLRGRFTLGNGSYADPGILVIRRKTYGVFDTVARCSTVDTTVEYYVRFIVAHVRCRTMPSGLVYTDGLYTLSLEYWSYSDSFPTPIRVGANDAIWSQFGGASDRFQASPPQFVPSTISGSQAGTMRTYQGVACSEVVGILNNAAFTIAVA